MPEVYTKTDDGIPSWLNGAFLENALKSEDCDGDLKITSYSIKRATAPGDNYLSVMYRATLHVKREGHSERISLIIKYQPDGETMKEVCISSVSPLFNFLSFI